MDPSAPTLLLSAAAYQIAGYPARASGVLQRVPSSAAESEILRILLAADFPELFKYLLGWWRNRPSADPPDDIGRMIATAIMRAAGVIAAAIRWKRRASRRSRCRSVAIKQFNPTARI
jgi:hypothetical protein